MIQRTLETDDGKRTVVEIQASHVAPELSAVVEITKSAKEQRNA